MENRPCTGRVSKSFWRMANRFASIVKEIENLSENELYYKYTDEEDEYIEFMDYIDMPDRIDLEEYN